MGFCCLRVTRYLLVQLILSRLFRATISVFFVPCCPVLLSFYLVLSYMFEEINGDGDGDDEGREKHAGCSTPAGSH